MTTLSRSCAQIDFHRDPLDRALAPPTAQAQPSGGFVVCELHLACEWHCAILNEVGCVKRFRDDTPRQRLAKQFDERRHIAVCRRQKRLDTPYFCV